MTDAGTVYVDVVPDLKRFHTSLRRQMARQMAPATRQMDDQGRRLGRRFGVGVSHAFGAARVAAFGLAKGMTIAGGAMAIGGVKAVQMAGKMEQSKIAFETLLGSAEKADRFVKQLFDFAAKTPFEFEGLQQSARQLLAFGFNAKEIIPMMRNIGDAVAALGGGAFEIDRVTRALGQMQAKGKVSAEEMMQLAELGIPAWQFLAQEIGVSIPEAMKRAERGAITGQQGIRAILRGMERRFQGSMQRQSTTLLGIWSTLKDNIMGFTIDIGNALMRHLNLKRNLAGVSDFLEGLRGRLQGFSQTLERGGGIGEAISTALGFEPPRGAIADAAKALNRAKGEYQQVLARNRIKMVMAEDGTLVPESFYRGSLPPDVTQAHRRVQEARKRLGDAIGQTQRAQRGPGLFDRLRQTIFEGLKDFGRWVGEALTRIDSQAVARTLGGFVRNVIQLFLQAIAAVNWFEVGRRAVVWAGKFAWGFVTGLFDFNTWKAVFGEKPLSTLLAVLGLALLPGRLATGLMAVLARFPLVGTILNWFIKGIRLLGTPLRAMFGRLFTRLGGWIRSGIGTAFTGAGVMGLNAWQRLWTGVQRVWGAIGAPVLSRARGGLRLLGTVAGTATVGGLKAARDWALRLFGRLGDVARRIGQWVLPSLGNLKGSLGGLKVPGALLGRLGLIAKFTALGAAIAGAVVAGDKLGRWLDDFLNKKTPFKEGPNTAVGRWIHKRAPWFLLQHGGRARRGRGYVVGEAGPELFIPDVTGTVVSNRDLGRFVFDAVEIRRQIEAERRLALATEARAGATSGLIDTQKLLASTVGNYFRQEGGTGRSTRRQAIAQILQYENRTRRSRGAVQAFTEQVLGTFRPLGQQRAFMRQTGDVGVRQSRRIVQSWTMMLGRMVSSTFARMGDILGVQGRFLSIFMGAINRVRGNVGLRRVPFASISADALFRGRRLATGATNFQGGLAIVGEKGPEIVRLPPGSVVAPHKDTQRILGAMGLPFGGPYQRILDYEDHSARRNPGGRVVYRLTPAGRSILDFLRQKGVPFEVSSAWRPSPSGSHSTGNAVDLIDPQWTRHGEEGPSAASRRGMQRIANAFLPVADKISELAFSLAGFGISNGRRVSPFHWGAQTYHTHFSHVHVAAREILTRVGRMLGVGRRAAAGLIADPVGLFRRALGGVGVPLLPGALRPVNPRFTRQVIGRFLSTLQEFTAGPGPIRGIRGPVRGNLAGWIRRAMGITGAPDWWFPLLYQTAMSESGGNPFAINRWDINARRGDPSRGLMQTIGATFARYALPGMRNIFDPIHNLVASIRYRNARYSGGDFSPYGPISPYDYGAVLQGPGLAPIGRIREALIPLTGPGAGRLEGALARPEPKIEQHFYNSRVDAKDVVNELRWLQLTRGF